MSADACWDVCRRLDVRPAAEHVGDCSTARVKAVVLTGFGDATFIPICKFLSARSPVAAAA